MKTLKGDSRWGGQGHRIYMEKEPAITPTHGPALLTTDQAAAYLGISKSTLAHRRSAGLSTPRAVQIGRTLRYRTVDLDQWIEQHLEPVN